MKTKTTNTKTILQAENKIDPKTIIINFAAYMKKATNTTPPTKEDFAKKTNLLSFSSIQKALSVYGDEGDDALKYIDSQLVVWYTNWIAKADNKLELDKRIFLAKLNGLDGSKDIKEKIETQDFDADILFKIQEIAN